jgi:hypothetical protein
MLQLQHLRASRKAQRVAFVMGRLLLCDGGSNILCFVKPTSPRCLSIFFTSRKIFYTIYYTAPGISVGEQNTNAW